MPAQADVQTLTILLGSLLAQALGLNLPIHQESTFKLNQQQQVLSDTGSDAVTSFQSSAKTSLLQLQDFSVYGGYHLTIGVGSPPQPMKVVLDINSPDTFIESINCTTILCSKADTQYDSSKSSTFVPNSTSVSTDTQWVVASGVLSQDTFHFGNDIASPGQLFQESTSLWPVGIGNFPDHLKNINGQLGLTPYAISSSLNISSPFQQLIASNSLKENLFAIRLAPPAQLSFGEINATLYQEPIEYLRLTHEIDGPDKNRHFKYLTGRWQTPATHISLSSASDPSIDTDWSLSGKIASFTTAHPFTSLPFEIVMKIYSSIRIDPPIHFPFTIDCARRAHLPNITLSLDGSDFSLSGFDYTMEWHDDVIRKDENKCAVLFWGEDGDSKSLEVGSGFLRKFYAVFDFDRQTIGLASVAEV